MKIQSSKEFLESYFKEAREELERKVASEEHQRAVDAAKEIIGREKKRYWFKWRIKFTIERREIPPPRSQRFKEITLGGGIVAIEYRGDKELACKAYLDELKKCSICATRRERLV